MGLIAPFIKGRAGFGLCIAAALAAGVLLRMRALDGVLLADDYDHYAMRKGLYPLARGWLDLFNFVGDTPAERSALLSTGRLPWWADLDLELSVFRPLSSALVAFDYSVLDGDPFWMHLHSFLWWGLLVLAAGALYWRVLPPRVAAVSVLLYALDEAHALTVTWIANRSALVSIALLALGLCAHVEYRTRKQVVYGAVRAAPPHAKGSVAPLSRPNRDSHLRATAGKFLLAAEPVLPAAFVALALLGGEHALAPLAYFVCFEVFVMRDAVRRRMLALLPVVTLGAVYVAVRALLGYGISGSGFYIDPIASPWRFLVASVERLPLLSGDLWFGFGGEWFLAGPPFVERLRSLDVLPQGLLELQGLRGLQLGLGAVSLLLSVALLLWLGRSGLAIASGLVSVRWLLAGALLSLVPMCATLPMSRLTLAAAIGADAVLAFVLCSAVQFAWEARALARRAAAATLALAIFAVHGVHAGVRARGDVAYYTARSVLEQNWIALAEIDERTVGERHLVVVSAADWTSQWAIPYARKLVGRSPPKSTVLLSGAATSRHRLSRPLANVLDLEIVDEPIDSAFAGSVYRPRDAPLKKNERIANPHFKVHVLAVEHGQPTHLRFVFPAAPEALGYAFLYPFPGGLRHLALPPEHGHVELPVPSPPR